MVSLNFSQRVVCVLLATAAVIWTTSSDGCAATLLHVVVGSEHEYTYNSHEGDIIHPSVELQLRGAGYSGWYEPTNSEGPEWLVNGVSFQILGFPKEVHSGFWRANRPWTIDFSAGESFDSGFRELAAGEYDASDEPSCTLTAAYNNCGAGLSVEGPGVIRALQLPIEETNGFDELRTISVVDGPRIEYLPGTIGFGATRGRYEVLEAKYGPNGEVLKFAADFEQYNSVGDTVLAGQLRYNSNVPAVPEPTTWYLLLSGVVAAVTRPCRS